MVGTLWSDKEKMDMCLAIIACHNVKINWGLIPLGSSRTIPGAKRVLGDLLKDFKTNYDASGAGGGNDNDDDGDGGDTPASTPKKSSAAAGKLSKGDGASSAANARKPRGKKGATVNNVTTTTKKTTATPQKGKEVEKSLLSPIRLHGEDELVFGLSAFEDSAKKDVKKNAKLESGESMKEPFWVDSDVEMDVPPEAEKRKAEMDLDFEETLPVSKKICGELEASN